MDVSCPKCGKPAEEGDAFCAYCGRALPEAGAPETVEPQPVKPEARTNVEGPGPAPGPAPARHAAGSRVASLWLLVAGLVAFLIAMGLAAWWIVPRLWPGGPHDQWVLYTSNAVFPGKLARGSSQLWAARRTGGDAHPLTDLEEGVAHAALSKDGKVAALVGGPRWDFGRHAVYVLDSKRGLRRVAEAVKYVGDVVASDDGAWIAWTESDSPENGPARIVGYDTRSGSTKAVTRSKAGIRLEIVGFRPKTAELLYRVSNRKGPGTSDLFLVDAAAPSIIRRLTNNDFEEDGAAFSPSGDRLVFVSRVYKNTSLVFPRKSELYVIELDGARLRRVTDNSDFESAPGWSGNGERLAVFVAKSPPAKPTRSWDVRAGGIQVIDPATRAATPAKTGMKMPKDASFGFRWAQKGRELLVWQLEAPTAGSEETRAAIWRCVDGSQPLKVADVRATFVELHVGSDPDGVFVDARRDVRPPPEVDNWPWERSLYFAEFSPEAADHERGARVIDPGGRGWTSFVGTALGSKGGFVKRRALRDPEAESSVLAKASGTALYISGEPFEGKKTEFASELHAIGLDGRNLRHLTNLGLYIEDARVSPDGRLVAFTTTKYRGWRYHEDEEQHAYLLDVKSNRLRKLDEVDRKLDSQLAIGNRWGSTSTRREVKLGPFSPDGAQFPVAANNEAFLVDTLDLSLAPLGSTSGGGGYRGWDAYGRLAGAQLTDGYLEWRTDFTSPDAVNKRRVSTRDLEGDWGGMDWSAKSGRFVVSYYDSTGADDWSLYRHGLAIVGKHGQGFTQVLSRGGMEADDPRWAPDGSRFAYRTSEFFREDTNGDGKVDYSSRSAGSFVMTWPARKMSRIPIEGMYSEGDNPEYLWSPDGRLIVTSDLGVTEVDSARTVDLGYPGYYDTDLVGIVE